MSCCRPSTSHVRHDGRVEQARERRRRLDQRRLHDADLEAVSQLQDDDREERRLPSHELHQLSIPFLLGLHAEGTQSSWRPCPPEHLCAHMPMCGLVAGVVWNWSLRRHGWLRQPYVRPGVRSIGREQGIVGRELSTIPRRLELCAQPTNQHESRAQARGRSREARSRHEGRDRNASGRCRVLPRSDEATDRGTSSSNRITWHQSRGLRIELTHWFAGSIEQNRRLLYYSFVFEYFHAKKPTQINKDLYIMLRTDLQRHTEFLSGLLGYECDGTQPEVG